MAAVRNSREGFPTGPNGPSGAGKSALGVQVRASEQGAARPRQRGPVGQVTHDVSADATGCF